MEEVEGMFHVKLSRDIKDIRQGEAAKKFASINKVKRELGWEPKRSLRDSIKGLKAWYKKYPNGWTY